MNGNGEQATVVIVCKADVWPFHAHAYDVAGAGFDAEEFDDAAALADERSVESTWRNRAEMSS